MKLWAHNSQDVFVIVMPQFYWLCDVRGCVMSLTSGIYSVDLGFINNYKEPQLWLILLRYSVNMTSAFPWVITVIYKKNVFQHIKILDTESYNKHAIPHYE